MARLAHADRSSLKEQGWEGRRLKYKITWLQLEHLAIIHTVETSRLLCLFQTGVHHDELRMESRRTCVPISVQWYASTND